MLKTIAPVLHCCISVTSPPKYAHGHILLPNFLIYFICKGAFPIYKPLAHLQGFQVFSYVSHKDEFICCGIFFVLLMLFRAFNASMRVAVEAIIDFSFVLTIMSHWILFSLKKKFYPHPPSPTTTTITTTSLYYYY